MENKLTQPNQQSRRQKVVLVTGAGSGIGLALAELLWHREDLRVVVTARPLALKNIFSSGFHETNRFWIRPLDVLSKNSRRVLISQIQERWGGVDVLINNAGISFRSSIEDMDNSEEELQMGTNYFGPIGLIREVLPCMRRKRSGQILNVSSVGGMMAMPTMGSYSASKFALEGASEALWYELRPWGISVSLIQPGFINSNSFMKVYQSTKARSVSEYAEYYKQMSSFISKLMRRTYATPQSVASKIVAIVDAGSGPLRIPATPDAHLFSFLRRIIPRELYHRILYRFLPNIDNWVDKDERTENFEEIQKISNL